MKVSNVPKEAVVVLIPAMKVVGSVVPAGIKSATPDTSQSPAVRVMLAKFVLVAVVSGTDERLVGAGYSPTLPVFALLLVVVPTIPDVCEGVKFPVTVRAAAETVPVKVGEASGA